MKNHFQQFIFIIALSLVLAGCQTDQEKPAVKPVIQEKAPVPAESNLSQKPAIHEQKTVVEKAVTQQVLTPEKTSVNVDLNLSDEFLKKLDDDQNLAAEPPAQIAKATDQQRKIKVSGGVLLDKEKGDLADKVDGGKVKLSIPLN